MTREVEEALREAADPNAKSYSRRNHAGDAGTHRPDAEAGIPFRTARRWIARYELTVLTEEVVEAARSTLVIVAN